MASRINLDSLAFDVGGRHISGKRTILGISIGVTLAALYCIRRYFNGGVCRIKKDLTGKNIVVTGGSDGIGKETVKRLLKLNGNVIFGARDEKKNQQVVAELSKIGKGKIVAFKLDLADRASIQNFAANVKRQLFGKELDYLLNNAGVFANPKLQKTSENLQMQIGVNHFGHFYLTYLLWQKLKQSPNPRIVNVSSRYHEQNSEQYNIDFNNMNFERGGYNPLIAYSRAKKANVIFTKQLQKRMDLAGIKGISVSLHPGLILTNIQNNLLTSWWIKLTSYLMYPFLKLTTKSVSQGAQTNLYCLLEDDGKLVKGGYYQDCKIAVSKSKQVENPMVAQRLWEESEKVFGIQFKI